MNSHRKFKCLQSVTKVVHSRHRCSVGSSESKSRLFFEQSQHRIYKQIFPELRVSLWYPPMEPPWASISQSSLSKPFYRCSGSFLPALPTDRFLYWSKVPTKPCKSKVPTKPFPITRLTFRCSVKSGAGLHEIADDEIMLNPRESQAHFVSWFREAWPYIQGHQGSTFVLVISAEIIDSPFVDGICQVVSYITLLYRTFVMLFLNCLFSISCFYTCHYAYVQIFKEDVKGVDVYVFV